MPAVLQPDQMHEGEALQQLPLNPPRSLEIHVTLSIFGLWFRWNTHRGVIDLHGTRSYPNKGNGQWWPASGWLLSTTYLGTNTWPVYGYAGTDGAWLNHLIFFQLMSFARVRYSRLGHVGFIIVLKRMKKGRKIQK